jgi:NCAIR mutase (PurE)-related protein
MEHMPFEDIGFARVDHHRSMRCGSPEVVFGLGKTPQQVEQIVARLAATGANLLVTRAEPSAAELVLTRFPAAVHDPVSRTVALRQRPAQRKTGPVLITAAGTSDLPVAEEARITAEMMDCHVETAYDVGVAGLHRLLDESKRLREAVVIVVVAGMEGALPSVVGGLVRCPVIAVPTSVGYGASLGGLAALLAMLNSCASSVSVVNIDNGFGGGYQAALISRVGRQETQPEPEP